MLSIVYADTVVSSWGGWGSIGIWSGNSAQNCEYLTNCSGSAPQITWTAPSSGTYRVRISNGSNGGPFTIAYNLPVGVQIVGGIVGIIATIGSGWIAARIGKRTTVGALAAVIGVFSLLTPLLMGGSPAMQDTFILLGFALLGISYGQASGTVTANFERRFRYTGAALTSDFAWLFGAAFAPLVALGLSAKFGLLSVTVYLLSGVICTLLALAVNQTLVDQNEE